MTDAELAGQLIDAFLAGDGATLCAAGDPAFAAAADPARLAALAASLGPAQDRGPLAMEARGAAVLVTAPVTFAAGGFELRLALRGGALAGFFVAPRAPAWTPPAYAEAGAFAETDVVVAGLPGTLTLPRGVERPPVALFVHGSGPCDRDETLGPNKPLRDLAQGLASRGIASLRYDKRTRVAPEAFAALAAPTVKDEVLDDVAAALDWLAARENLGARFVIGHSLGAMLAPRIGAEHPDVAGLVMIATPARPLAEVTLAQIEYLDRLDPAPAGKLEAARADLARARAARPGDVGPPVFGAPLSWWADLNVYDVVEAARAAPQPMLILHGGRDYQVTDEDFARLGGAQRRRFPALNHLMMAGGGESRPEEYQRPGHVDVEVIEAVAAFISASAAQ
jgi:alpha-beta hydrolase superfamily lysophospholipase